MAMPSWMYMVFFAGCNTVAILVVAYMRRRTNAPPDKALIPWFKDVPAGFGAISCYRKEHPGSALPVIYWLSLFGACVSLLTYALLR
jgi:hypothetical protein